MKRMKEIHYIKIFLLILLFVVLSFLIPSNSYAWSDSSFSGGISIGYANTSHNYTKLKGTQNLYCVWKRGRPGLE